MGKKKIAVQTGDEALQEADKIASAVAKAKSKSVSKKIDRGRLYVNASYNNTIVTVTNEKGDVISWASAGSMGFNGPKKATPFAAGKVIAALAEKLRRSGPFNVDVFVSGIGAGRDSAIRSLLNHGFEILSLRDVTPIAHNGPRAKKVRRV